MINNANDPDNIVREKIRKNEMLRCSTYISVYFSCHGKIYKIRVAINALNGMKRIFRFYYAMLGNRACSQPERNSVGVYLNLAQSARCTIRFCLTSLWPHVEPRLSDCTGSCTWYITSIPKFRA